MRLTKFNPETGQYEYKEHAKTQEEFMAQRKAVIQKLGEYEDKASDVAEEIFAEIENALELHIESFTKFHITQKIAELKKKYIGKDTNVTTNTEEGK